MVETSSNIRNCSSLDTCCCESLDSYCWTLSRPTTGVSAPTIPDIGLGVNYQLYIIGITIIMRGFINIKQMVCVIRMPLLINTRSLGNKAKMMRKIHKYAAYLERWT